MTAALVLAVAAPAAAHAAVPNAVKRSNGTSTAYTYSWASYTEYGYAFHGQIHVGSDVFHGDAKGSYRVDSYDGTSVLFVTGSGAEGVLHARCTDNRMLGLAAPTADALRCTGHIGDYGPDAGFTLAVVYPFAEEYNGPKTTSYSYTGRFAE
jgi:hypothetical protein